MNNSGLIIFSRLDSSRLPQKALKKIGKKTLLEHVIDRAKQVQGKKKIIIATSKRTIDDQIASFAKINSIDIFRGNYKDIVKRAYDCCQFFNLKKFARICGDRPFFDPKILNFLFTYLEINKIDFATNNKIKTFPAGMVCEVLTFNTLKKIIFSTNHIYQREHITDYIYKNEKEFKIFNYKCPIKGVQKKHFAVDTNEDLKKMNWFFENYNGNLSKISLKQLIKLDDKYNEVS